MHALNGNPPGARPKPDLSDVPALSILTYGGRNFWVALVQDLVEGGCVVALPREASDTESSNPKRQQREA